MLADLYAHAEADFKLDRPQGSSTVRAHLLTVANRTGTLPKALAALPDLPAPVAHVYRWFRDLSNGRGSTGFGPAALSYAEIAAWAALNRIDPDPWEVAAIRRLDVLFLAEAARWADAPRDGDSPRT